MEFQECKQHDGNVAAD